MKTVTYNPLTHKIVPIQATEEMSQAYYKGQRNHGFWYCAPVYASVIAAAPEYQESSQWISVEERLQSQAQQTESKPVLKVHNGEICYQSTDDDQCYGMWCPVSYDTEHSYKEGTKFIAIPPAPEGDKP